MKRTTFARRLLSIGLATAMITPAISSVAEAVVGTWLSPKPGQTVTARNVEVSVGYNTESSLKVTRLELWIDGKFYEKKILVNPDTRGVCSFWWDTARTSRGTHDLEVRIFAGNEMIATVSGTGTVGEPGYDLRPPTVRFSNIRSGDVLSGTARIEMAASDDSGQPPIVSLLVDNALKLLTNRAPYVCELDTKQYSDGNHELQSVAYDSAGNKSDPAVVKVAFRNNQERPVVTTMSVNPAPSGVAPSEDDGVGQVLPPVSEVPAAREAARAAEPAPTVGASAPTARPVARATKPVATAMVSAAAEPTARPAETRPGAVAAQPKASPVVAARSTAREAGVRAPAPRATVAAVEPASRPAEQNVAGAIPAPHSAKPAAVDVRRESSGLRGGPEGLVAASLPQEPPMPARSIGSPSESSARTVVASARPAERSAGIRVEVSPGAPVEPGQIPASEAVSRTAPEAVSVRSTAAASVPSEMRKHALRPSSAGHVVVPAVPFIGGPTPSSPAPVRAAMLPSLRGPGGSLCSQHAIANLPVPPRETRAKIEQRTIPASGKAKLRDLFDQLGGVLFWDPITHTVTGYVGDIKLEIRIGSATVRANGVEINIGQVPVVVDGRTVIDAGALRQVLAKAGMEQALAGK